MKEVTDLLKEQNELIAKQNKLFEDNLGEFKRILKLQAAETNVMNARFAITEEVLKKGQETLSELRIIAQRLLDNRDS